MKYSGTPTNVPQFKAFGVQFQSSQINNLNYTHFISELQNENSTEI
jgi:hypothetical protein